MDREILVVGARSVNSPARINEAEAFTKYVEGITGVRASVARDVEVARARSKLVPVNCHVPAFIPSRSGAIPPLGNKWPAVGSVQVEWTLRGGTILSAVGLASLIGSKQPVSNIDWADCIATPGTIFCQSGSRNLRDIALDRMAEKLQEWGEKWPDEARAYLDIAAIVEKKIDEARNRLRSVRPLTPPLIQRGTPTAILAVFSHEEMSADGKAAVRILKLPTPRPDLPATALVSGHLPRHPGSEDRLVHTIEHICSHLWLLNSAEAGFRHLRSIREDVERQDKLKKWLTVFVQEYRPIWTYGVGEDLIEQILQEFAGRTRLHERWQHLATDALLLHHVSGS